MRTRIDMNLIDVLLTAALAAVFVQNFFIRRKLVRLQHSLKEFFPAIMSFSDTVDRAEKAVAGSSRVFREGSKPVQETLSARDDQDTARIVPESREDLMNQFYKIAQGGKIT